ncbi:MAG: OmpA family protein [bacterium]
MEAHTDNIKPKGYPSNWELSSERANAIFNYLAERGLSKKRCNYSPYREIRNVYV